MDSASFLPLSTVSFSILLSLASEPRHGYAIWKDVENLSSGSLKLSTSTLYDALERLLQQGLIERASEGSPQSSARPRKKYRLSKQGRQVLASEIERMRELLEVAIPRLPEILG